MLWWGNSVMVRCNWKKGRIPFNKFKALMQCGRLFLFWNKWRALIGQHFRKKRENSQVLPVFWVSSSQKGLHDPPAKSVNKYSISYGSGWVHYHFRFTWKNPVLLLEMPTFINVSRREDARNCFHFSDLCRGSSFNGFPGNGEERWRYFEQPKIIDSDSVFHSYQKRLIFA